MLRAPERGRTATILGYLADLRRPTASIVLSLTVSPSSGYSIQHQLKIFASSVDQLPNLRNNFCLTLRVNYTVLINLTLHTSYTYIYFLLKCIKCS